MVVFIGTGKRKEQFFLLFDYFEMKISSPNLNDMLSISIESNSKKLTKSGINPVLFPTLGHLGAKNANYSKLGIDLCT